jgi:hypothetical protein
MGRPLKFKSTKELSQKVDSYFDNCDSNTKPYTISGLALWLDTSRKVLLEYEQKEEFSNTIKKAKAKCEAYAEEQLFRARNVAGIIFNLKNNYGWRDRQEVSNTFNEVTDFDSLPTSLDYIEFLEWKESNKTLD